MSLAQVRRLSALRLVGLAALMLGVRGGIRERHRSAGRARPLQCRRHDVFRHDDWRSRDTSPSLLSDV